jgi:hypothetical protein
MILELETFFLHPGAASNLSFGNVFVFVVLCRESGPGAPNRAAIISNQAPTHATAGLHLDGVLIRFITMPSGVPRNAWQLLAIFLSTIVNHGLVQHTLNETPHPIQAVPLTTLSSSPYACIASNLPRCCRRLSLALLIM